MTEAPAGTVPGLPAPGRCLVMGVVNVTPDSFSDGGAWFDRDKAIAHGLALMAQGADLVDVGGESTRPGAQRVSPAEELRRVIPVIKALTAEGVPVSVDTMRAETAAAAIEVGARLINDVSGGLADAEMALLVAKTGVPYVVMHWRGHSHDMNTRAIYADPVREVIQELSTRIEAVLEAGVDRSRLVVDPGLGFAKRAEHDLALLAHLEQLTELGLPVLIGASRKRFLGRILAGTVSPPGADPQTPGASPKSRTVSPPGADPQTPGASPKSHTVSPLGADPQTPGASPKSRGDGTPRPFMENDHATMAITALAAAAGAWCVRVHNVPPNADAVRVAAAVRAAR